ncbi:MAG: NAD(P)H-hydrate dehydratase [Candidatus Aenigmarchaeota archaeon]|nr:NAD(P)H-hydrate dehydratase [Candidatus Aenigmarchaeota archaeon]
MHTFEKALVKKLYPPRPPESHKGDFGKLLVVGGSIRYSGSPALAALAAYRAGADLVTVAAPKRAADIVAGFSPDIITYPLDYHYLNNHHLHHVIDLMADADALVVGNGAERIKETKGFIINLLKKAEKPCVLDADAIHAVAENRDVIKSNYVITPHQHEFSVLTGIKLEGKPLNERIEAVKKSAGQLNATILLKGHADIISNGNETAVNKTGCAEMTKGGTGDTLAGICGALLARGAKPFDAACCAAYINGLAGEMAAKKFGEGMLAYDLIWEIPNVIGGAVGKS